MLLGYWLSLFSCSSAQGTGTLNCAMLSIIVDESGSMGLEQRFIRDVAQEIIGALSLQNVDVTYVSTFGYTDGGAQPRGSSVGYDPNDFIFQLTGSIEDGYEAINFAVNQIETLINDPAGSIDGFEIQNCASVRSEPLINTQSHHVPQTHLLFLVAKSFVSLFFLLLAF